jgi:hypothetical protein
MNRLHKSSIALTLAALLASAAHANTTNDGPIDALKREYLACDRAAVNGQLSTGGVMHCSIVYESLKHRAFDGDFEKLLDWARAQEAERHAGRR